MRLRLWLVSLVLMLTPFVHDTAEAAGVSLQVSPVASGITIDVHTNLRRVRQIGITIDGTEVTTCDAGSRQCSYYVETTSLPGGLHTAQAAVTYREPHRSRNRIKLSSPTVFNVQGGSSPASPPADPPAPNPPSDSGLIQQRNLTFVGGFRLPTASRGVTSFGFGAGGLVYNPSGNGGAGSLLIAASYHSGGDTDPNSQEAVSEVTIPALSTNSDITIWNTASFLQPFADATQGKYNNITSPPSQCLNGCNARGLYIANNKLYIGHYVGYDAGPNAVSTMTVSSTNLSNPNATGPFAFATPSVAGTTSPIGPGYYGGWIVNIPPAYRSQLGADTLSGLGSISIISRTSAGPAAFAFNIGDVGARSPIPNTPLLFYPIDHTTLNNPVDTFGFNAATVVTNVPSSNGTSTIGGAVIPEGYRSLVFFGFTGVGSQLSYRCGSAQNPPPPPDAGCPDGYAYDPVFPDVKGYHAYPYSLYAWAYDLNDLIAAKNGTKRPWEPLPYATWPFILPNGTPNGYPHNITGVAYDPGKRRIFLMQEFSDNYPYAQTPLIYVFTHP